MNDYENDDEVADEVADEASDSGFADGGDQGNIDIGALSLALANDETLLDLGDGDADPAGPLAPGDSKEAKDLQKALDLSS